MKLAPEIMNEVFDIIESPYPLRNELRSKSRNIRTVRYGIETATFVGSRIQSYMPSELKESTSLNEFRSKIKAWKPENCSCKLCKIYLQRIGYLKVTNQYLLIDTAMLLYLFTYLFSWVFFFFVVVFLLSFVFPPFSFNTHFKFDLNQPRMPDKGYICSLIYIYFSIVFFTGQL